MSDWKAIIENALGKCADFDPDCPTCQVWAGIADLEAQLATALEQADGWKAEAMTQNAAIHGAIEAACAEGYADGARDEANAIDARGAKEQADFGLCRGTQNFYRAARLARSLLQPDNGKGGDA
jgi:hypothetical protein